MATKERSLTKHILRAIEFNLPLFWERGEGSGAWKLIAITDTPERGGVRTRTISTVYGLRAVDTLTRRLWAAGRTVGLKELTSQPLSTTAR